MGGLNPTGLEDPVGFGQQRNSGNRRRNVFLTVLPFYNLIVCPWNADGTDMADFTLGDPVRVVVTLSGW
jgi:hypothetical protein